MKIRASGESLIKNPERGVLLDQNECWGAGAHSTTNPDDLFLQSAGIQFEAVNLDIKEVAGEERWVQIITREEYSKTFDDGAKLITMLEDALDVCYPTWSGTKAADAPGIPLEIKGRRLEHNPGSHLDSTHKTQTNRLYLMFKPDGDENEWVPLKIVNWEWRGGAEWHNSTSKWGPFDCAISPAEPQAEDTSEYPEWEKNAGDDKAYKVTHR